MNQLHAAQERELGKILARGRREYAASNTLVGFSNLLAWQMGTGKTPSTLVYVQRVIELLKANGDPRANRTTVIVVPAQVKRQWLSEAKTWLGCSEYDCKILGGPPDQREFGLQYVDVFKPKFLVLNYELLVIHQQWFQEREWLGLVVDEAHAIKNEDALRSRAVMSINAEFTLLLTGTPVDNRPPDLYNLLKRLDPGGSYLRSSAKLAAPNKRCPLAVFRVRFDKAYYSRNRLVELKTVRNDTYAVFGRHYEYHTLPNVPEHCQRCDQFVGDPYTGSCKHGGSSGGKEPVQIRYRKSSPSWGTKDNFDMTYAMWDYGRFGKVFKGARNTAQLNRRLYDELWATRVRRSDMGSIGGITYRYVYLDMTDEQEALYAQVRAGIISRMDAAGEMNQLEIKSKLTELMYLEMVAASTPKDFYDNVSRNRPEWMSISRQSSQEGAKQEWLEEFVDGLNGGDKAIIFTQYRTVAEPLVERLSKSGHRVVAIHGNVSQRERDAAQNAFNSDPDTKVIVVTKAGFEGLNLQKGVGKGDTIHCVFTDVSWVPKNITQPIARAHRFGLQGGVWVWFLCANDSIDRRKIDELRSKQVYIDQIVDGRETQAIKLFEIDSKQGLLELL